MCYRNNELFLGNPDIPFHDLTYRRIDLRGRQILRLTQACRTRASPVSDGVFRLFRESDEPIVVEDGLDSNQVVDGFLDGLVDAVAEPLITPQRT